MCRELIFLLSFVVSSLDYAVNPVILIGVISEKYVMSAID